MCQALCLAYIISFRSYSNPGVLGEDIITSIWAEGGGSIIACLLQGLSSPDQGSSLAPGNESAKPQPADCEEIPLSTLF